MSLPPSVARFLRDPLFLRRIVRWRMERVEVERAKWARETIGPAVPRGSALLDVGSWDGRTAQLLAESRGARVTCVDVVDHNQTDLPFRTFDGSTLPWEDGSFDAVTLLFVLHHSAHDAVLLREAARVCRVGGRVIVAEDLVETGWQRFVTVAFHLRLWLWTRMGWHGAFRRVADWKARFADAGLDVVEERPLPRFPGRRFWPRNVLFVLEPSR
jgi:SAM-dependent methyltransferase